MQQQAIVVKTTRAEQQLKLAVSILQAFILFAIFFSQTRRITGYHYIEIGKRINKYKTHQKTKQKIKEGKKDAQYYVGPIKLLACFLREPGTLIIREEN